MTELIGWLRVQLDEDERVARSASPGPWKPNAEHDEVLAVDDERVADGFALSGRQLRATVDHVARHDPARVLAEVDAKRRILDDLLAEKHLVVEDCWYTCAAATELRDGETTCRDDVDPACECGRDARVERRVRLLALPYADRPGYRDEWRP